MELIVGKVKIACKKDTCGNCRFVDYRGYRVGHGTVTYCKLLMQRLIMKHGEYKRLKSCINITR